MNKAFNQRIARITKHKVKRAKVRKALKQMDMDSARHNSKVQIIDVKDSKTGEVRTEYLRATQINLAVDHKRSLHIRVANRIQYSHQQALQRRASRKVV